MLSTVMPSAALCLPQTGITNRLSCQRNGRSLHALLQHAQACWAALICPLLVEVQKGQMLMCPLSHPSSKEKHRSTFACLLCSCTLGVRPQHSSSIQGRALQRPLTTWRCSLWPVTDLPAKGQHVHHRVAVRVLRSVRLHLPTLPFHSLLALPPCSSEVLLHHHAT